MQSILLTAGGPMLAFWPVGHLHHAGQPGGLARYDFLTNYGNYMPRLHCLQTAEGETDWLWSGILIFLSCAVVVGYLRIFLFWRRNYLAEAPEYRNTKLMDLAHVFFWCAICSYLMSVVMFFWPAYRLLAILLLILTFFTWKFASNLSDFKVSLSAKRLQAELEQTLRDRNAELERQVAARTTELETARAEAERANAAKSDFLATMSHEIRTPLTSLIGYAELLDENDHARVIRRQGRHLLSVINDVLDMSKIEAGQMDVEQAPCSPALIVLDVAEMLRDAAEAKGLALEVEFPNPLPDSITTDPTRLRQILINLVGNAIKFTDRGHVRIVTTLEDSLLRIDVIDSGAGMSDDARDRIFDAFTQAAPAHAGTGLGLTIARRLAELLGGSLEVHSEQGQGSTFTCRIYPGALDGATLVDPHEAAHDADDRHAIRLQGAVLVVDDCADNRRLIEHLLLAAGADVTTAHNGDAAVAAAESSDFDLVLMDLEMPGMDGRETVRRIRSSGVRTPVVALTAHALADVRTRCLEAGYDDFATKPIQRPELLDLCHRWLTGRAAA